MSLFCFFCSPSTQIAQGQRHSRRRLQTNPEYTHLIENTEIGNAFGHALMSSRPVKVGIEPEDSPAPCSSPSAKWLKEQASTLSDEDLENFFDWHLYTLPFAYKLFVEPTQTYADDEEHSSFDGQHGTPSSQEYFGLDGQHTEEIQLIHDQAQEFWSDSGVDDDIRILCAHGSDLADRHEKLLPTLEILFGDSYNEEYTIHNHATDIQDLILRLPGGYNFPLLTFNAFATEQVAKDDFPAIIIGDGYFEFQDSVGLSSEGPEYALTHEHAHHLQFALGVHEEEEVDPTQVTRRQELLADALSAYFLAHDMGGDMDPEEILNVHTVAYSVGDCAEDHDGHHGTPRQRWCATHWGATLADAQEFDGENTMELTELKERYDAWYERVDDLDEFCGYSASSAASFSKNFHTINRLLVVAIAYGVANILGF